MASREYLHCDAQRLQELKQHHVHTLNDKGERVPLAHCRRPDKPSACKSEFPRTGWLCDEPVVVRRGLAGRFGMACRGRGLSTRRRSASSRGQSTITPPMVASRGATAGFASTCTAIHSGSRSLSSTTFIR